VRPRSAGARKLIRIVDNSSQASFNADTNPGVDLPLAFPPNLRVSVYDPMFPFNAYRDYPSMVPSVGSQLAYTAPVSPTSVTVVELGFQGSRISDNAGVLPAVPVQLDVCPFHHSGSAQIDAARPRK